MSALSLNPVRLWSPSCRRKAAIFCVLPVIKFGFTYIEFPDNWANPRVPGVRATNWDMVRLLACITVRAWPTKSFSAPFRLETFPKSLVQNYRHRATA